MGVSEEKNGVDGIPLEQPLTWRCPEGHVFRFRRRPLLSSCIFIFCFLIMERAAVYGLRAFLFRFVNKTLRSNGEHGVSAYMLIAFFFGLYDLSPILLALVSDTYLGCLKAIVVFGFTFVFGLGLAVISSDPAQFGFETWCPAWLAYGSLVMIAMSAGGLMQLLVTFGGGQFHPKTQTASGSRFFSLVYAISSFGAILGIVAAAGLWDPVDPKFYQVILGIAVMGVVGWVCFLAGAWSFVDRCVHSSKTWSLLSLAWSCVRQRSITKNMESNGGSYADKQVRDLELVARLLPIFVCLIPLYSGQLQVVTTLRGMERLMVSSGRFPVELLAVAEPVTMLVMALLLNEVVYPVLKRRLGVVVTHLTRLQIAAGLIAVGFGVCFGLQQRLMNQGNDFRKQISILWTLPAIIVFSIGQLLITSSGLELSWSHAPDSLKSVSVALFSSIYAFGSLISLGLFGTIGKIGKSGLEIYSAICGGLALVSLLGLTLMRPWYRRTRQMKIDRDIEERAIAIALARLGEENKFSEDDV
jgi:dipeptide/tripeptide permease